MIKNFLLFLSIVLFVLGSTRAYAAERIPLGSSNIAIKLDYIKLTDDDLKKLNVDTGLYMGIEGYGEIAPNLYLGLEAGYASRDGESTFNFSGMDFDIKTEVTLIPVELNFKYAIEATHNLVIDLGAGISYNYAKGEISLLGMTVDKDDWLFGGQFFADMNYKIGQFFIGINGKYQITEDMDVRDLDMNINVSNWRIGGQIGIMF